MSDETGKPVDLRQRLRSFSLRIIRLCDGLPTKRSADVIARQLIRSGTSVGAQHREAHRGRSTAEFVSKLESALQELDESAYWLDLLSASGLVKPSRLESLVRETDELIAIMVASVRTAKRSLTTKKKGDADR